MARNLRNKIALIIEDSYDLQNENVIAKLERLFNEELELRQYERTLSYNDIVYIQNVATQEFVKTRLDYETLGRLRDDPGMVRALCLFQATVSFLRQNGFLTTIFKYKK